MIFDIFLMMWSYKSNKNKAPEQKDAKKFLKEIIQIKTKYSSFQRDRSNFFKPLLFWSLFNHRDSNFNNPLQAEGKERKRLSFRCYISFTQINLTSFFYHSPNFNLFVRPHNRHKNQNRKLLLKRKSIRETKVALQTTELGLTQSVSPWLKNQSLLK